MRKKFLIVLLIAALCLSFAACGSSKSSEAYDANRSDDSYYSQYIAPGEYSYYKDEATGENSQQASFAAERKLVYTANISIETLDFEKSQQALNEALSSCGGYIYSSELFGGNRYSQSPSARSIYMTIKIPSDKYREFLNGRDNFGNVKFFSEQTDDITTQYIDTQSRLEALKEQEQRLLTLIEKAQSVKELLEIEETLSEVRYKIENYTSQMQAYDNMVTFCTVNIDITEVSEVSKVNKGFFTKLGEAFRSSWIELFNFLQNVVIKITSIFPFLLIMALIAFFVYKAIKKRKKVKTYQMPNFSETPSKETNEGTETEK